MSDTITPDMNVLEVIRQYKPTRDVFHAYDEQAGECVMCKTLFVSIREAAEQYNLNLDKLMAELNAAVVQDSA